MADTSASEPSPTTQDEPVHAGNRSDLTSLHTLALEFDEQAYLSVYDDVIVSLDTGEFGTAREHFEFHGKREGRLTNENYIRALGLAPAVAASAEGVAFSIDTMVYCRSDTLLIVDPAISCSTSMPGGACRRSGCFISQTVNADTATRNHLPLSQRTDSASSDSWLTIKVYRSFCARSACCAPRDSPISLLRFNRENIHWASPEVRGEVENFLAAEREFPPEQQLVFHNGGYHIDDLANRMSRIDWCIVPSTWWKIFGLVISEAWMFGKPVICSNRGGPGERVAHDVNGLQFQLGDARALAETIRRASTEDGLWERLSAALPEPPSRPAMAQEFLELYRRDMPALDVGMSDVAD